MHTLAKNGMGDKLSTRDARNVHYARLWRRSRGLFATAMWVEDALPRLAGTVLLGIFFSLVVSHGIIIGGHSETALKMVTASFGLDVAKIDIVGLERTSEIDVLEAIGLDGDSAMLAFDVTQAHEKILALPWVRAASLRKIYPNQLQIIITERQPVALWQYQGRLDVIDEQGGVIMPFVPGLTHHLPLLVGYGANLHGMQMLDVMEQFGDFSSRIRAYRRVANRRWDIVLENGLEIKLPQMHFEERLKRLLTDNARDNLLERDVLGIDLRLADRISVTLSDPVMARWRQQAGRG